MADVKGKLYCPLCKLVLSGDGHANETEAWELFECEYSVSQYEEKPIPELEINKQEIKRLTERKNRINKGIRELKARNAELTGE